MPPVWSYSALATGLVGCGVMLVLQPPGDTLPLWYLVIAVLGTGMSILGVRQAPRSRRRVWVAIAVGQMLYLLGDAPWYLYESVLLKVHMDGRGFLARYGGEEFTVLIPRSTPAAAEPLLELLRTSVGDAQTCSIGAVEWRHDEAPSQATPARRPGPLRGQASRP